jgi:hypothetical protein
MTGTEIAKPGISHVAAPGTAIGAMLEKYLWVHAITARPTTVHTWAGVVHYVQVRIEGIIKPDLNAADPASLRRGFAESFEAIMAILGTGGVRFEEHPVFCLRGKVCDGSQSFRAMEASVDMALIADG